METGIQESLGDDNPLFITQVFDRLLKAIALGELKPGERIRQSALAQQMKVSRQPVSHALQLLKHEGLVRDTGKQGVEVTPIDPDYMRQLYQARKVIEVMAIALAAQRVADQRAVPGPLANVIAEQVAALQEAQAAGQAVLRDGGALSALVHADYAFHTALYRLSGNVVIEQMMAGRWAHLMRSMLIVLDDPGTPHRAWDEHEEITEFVLSGNVIEAQDLAARHLQRASADMVKKLSRFVSSGANAAASIGSHRVSARMV